MTPETAPRASSAASGPGDEKLAHSKLEGEGSTRGWSPSAPSGSVSFGVGSKGIPYGSQSTSVPDCSSASEGEPPTGEADWYPSSSQAGGGVPVPALKAHGDPPLTSPSRGLPLLSLCPSRLLSRLCFRLSSRLCLDLVLRLWLLDLAGALLSLPIRAGLSCSLATSCALRPSPLASCVSALGEVLRVVPGHGVAREWLPDVGHLPNCSSTRRSPRPRTFPPGRPPVRGAFRSSEGLCSGLEFLAPCNRGPCSPAWVELLFGSRTTFDWR